MGGNGWIRHSPCPLFTFFLRRCACDHSFVMPKMGNQRKKAAGSKGAKVKLQMRFLAAQEASEEEKMCALWEAQEAFFRAMPMEIWEAIVRHAQQGLLGQINLLARLGGTCRAMRCVELELGSGLDWRVRVAQSFVVWRRAWEWVRARQTRKAAQQTRKLAVEVAEEEWRADVMAGLMPVYAEVLGRERELARMLGAKGEPPVLRILYDNAFRDSSHTVCQEN